MFLDAEDEVVLPLEYSISNAYPNPFNPVTNIDITVPESGLMQFAIYDILGRRAILKLWIYACYMIDYRRQMNKFAGVV